MKKYKFKLKINFNRFIKEKLLNLNFLPKNYTKAFDQFNEIYLSEASSVVVRTQKCAGIVTNVMPFSVGHLYVSRNFKNKSKTDVEEMVENIRDEFKTILNNTDWMDDISKNAAIEKV
jgi:predicted metalloendopeptidase